MKQLRRSLSRLYFVAMAIPMAVIYAIVWVSVLLVSFTIRTLDVFFMLCFWLLGFDRVYTIRDWTDFDRPWVMEDTWAGWCAIQVFNAYCWIGWKIHGE